MLSMVKTTLRDVKSRTYMAGRDIGEMFLNFLLEEEFHTYHGVYIINAYMREGWERGCLENC